MNRPFDEAVDLSSQSEQESDGEFSYSAGMKGVLGKRVREFYSGNSTHSHASCA